MQSSLTRARFSSLRSARLYFPSSIRTSLHLPRRASSSVSSSPRNFFEYTSGLWLVNNDLRLAERKREFDVRELRRLAAQSVNRKLQDVEAIEKLDEGGFNRVFLITMHDGFQMIARIPYPVLVPKFHAIASEVATMGFLRAHGLPVPKVYGYSPTSDNAAKTEYIFMEFVKGTKFADVWLQLKEADLASILRQLVKLESLMMSIPFPAGGSLYFADDLEKMAAEKTGISISLNGQRFCIGPDVRVHMWFGQRSQLDLNRGPYQNAEEALAAAALKEIAYLERFGRPLLPFQRGRREAYNYEKQSPLDHIENLQRYLLIAPSLIPDNPSLREFCIRHPDLQPSNVMVSTSPDSGQLEIVSLIDWQQASILPRFLLAGIPDEIQNYNDPISMHLIPPVFPSDADKMDEADLSQAKVTHHDRLVHFHYAKGTEEYNKVHHDAL
ncbi:kinase-like domain-containing protein [Roridomyces roridus]|uniref:Kinase-like domain-containing protein n=1 Tax=Roridomyces roridus TaxID=1738132 RepID=A0AAD7BR69_9AGAR|nr:kinase-like domain-containing protein [Roridomyces roridus]